MKNKMKKILAICLVAILAIAVVACAESVETPAIVEETNAAATTPVAPPAPVVPPVVQETITEVEYIEYTEYPLSMMERIEQIDIFRDARGLDTSLYLSVGLGENLEPLTYEHVVEMLEMLAMSMLFEEEMPDMSHMLTEYSLKLRISISYYGYETSAFSIGLPSVNGGFVDLLEVMSSGYVVYIGVAPIIDMAAELVSSVLDAMVAAGMPPMEASMIGILVGDILGRFEGVQYLSIDMSDFVDADVLEYMMAQTAEWYEFIFEIAEDLEAIIPMDAIITELENAGIIWLYDDWVVTEFDEQDAREMLEAMLDWMYSHAEDIIDILNTMMNQPFMLELMGMPAQTLTVEEFREDFADIDLSFFDEFVALFTAKARVDGNTVYEEVSAIISVEGFDIVVEADGYSVERTRPVPAPAASVVMTLRALFDEVLIDFTGMTYDEFLYYYVPAF